MYNVYVYEIREQLNIFVVKGMLSDPDVILVVYIICVCVCVRMLCEYPAVISTYPVGLYTFVFSTLPYEFSLLYIYI